MTQYLFCRCVAKCDCKGPQRKEYIEGIASFYRKIQVLVILCDKCFQSYIWPEVQFYGAILLISVLYVLIVLHQQLPQSGVWLLLLFLLSVALLICLVLRTGSKSIGLSRSVLQGVAVRPANEKDGWSKRFFKSCPTIAIRVGEFHKMDSERAPSFIRFVLQRTFFFVLKTKMNMSSVENGAVVSFM